MQFGNSNRLWVLNGGIHQIDATTGAFAGPDLPTAGIRCYDIRCYLPGKRGRPHRFDSYGYFDYFYITSFFRQVYDNGRRGGWELPHGNHVAELGA